MNMKKSGLIILACTLVLATQAALSQSTDPDAQSPQSPASAPSAQPPQAPIPAVAADSSDNPYYVGMKVSTLGVGVEVAARVMSHANLRAGFNLLGYSRTYTKDGIPYDGHLDFKTIEAHFDIFPWEGNFHVGPGILGYIGDPVTGHASIGGNQSFTLGGANFYSDPTNPTGVAGRIDFDSVAPTLTFGWSSLLPHRTGTHFSLPVELGVSFQGAPTATLNLTGNVCTSPGTNCQPASSLLVQTSVAAERAKIDNSMSFFKVYPIISIGFGYKF